MRKRWQIWGISSAGRAPRLHRGGQRFDPAMLHHIDYYRCLSTVFIFLPAFYLIFFFLFLFIDNLCSTILNFDIAIAMFFIKKKHILCFLSATITVVAAVIIISSPDEENNYNNDKNCPDPAWTKSVVISIIIIWIRIHSVHITSFLSL